MIKGATTEIVDVGHFLPQAFEDWFRRRDASAARLSRSVLLVDDSPRWCRWEPPSFVRGPTATTIRLVDLDGLEIPP